MGDTFAGASVDRAALSRVRDQLRTQLNERLGAQVADVESRFEDAYARFLESDNGAEAARLRLSRAMQSVSEARAEAQRCEDEAAKLPASSVDREELLERAEKMRVVATAREPIVAEVRERLGRLESEAAERRAVADAIEAENAQMLRRVNAAEVEMDRLDDKIRLLDREQDLLAVAHEVDADADALELEGDFEGAAERRQEAAWHRAQAEAARRDAAAISIDAAPLIDAGLDIPDSDDVASAVVDGDVDDYARTFVDGDGDAEGARSSDDAGDLDGDVAELWSSDDAGTAESPEVSATEPSLVPEPDRVGFSEYDDSFAVSQFEGGDDFAVVDAPIDDA